MNLSFWSRSQSSVRKTTIALTALSFWLASGITPALAGDRAYQVAQNSQPQTPQSSQAPEKWIEIYLSSQRLIAWEGTTPVYAVIISTGKKATPTPKGTFTIQSKHRVARMQGEDYDVPDVPYTMYYSGNYAIHGAYWHRRFGTPVSHGCTNVAVNHARWLFDWAPLGTPVVVRN